MGISGRRSFLRGSINYQVNRIFKESNLFRPGQSKHEEKALARGNGARTWADLGAHLSIYSYQTAQTYKDVWHAFGHYAKAELGLRDLEAVQGEHVADYLRSRIEDGIQYSTWQKEAAALGKLENALNLFAKETESGRTYNIRSQIADVRREAAEVLGRSTESRAYKDADGLIKNILDNKYELAARIQREGGARLYEASKIDKDQLSGIGKDDHTGKNVGWIRLDGNDTKGGKGRTIAVSEETYKRLEGHIARHGAFVIDSPQSYRRTLMEAAERSEQPYTGSHGLRWNFARERMAELQREGYTYEQCLAQTSWDMGHERPDITLHYLL